LDFRLHHNRIRDPAGATTGNEGVEGIRGLAHRQLGLGESTRNQLTQYRMQAAQQLGAQPAQITVAARPQPQHRGVIVVRCDFVQPASPQRGHRDRARIVGIVLVQLPGVEQPHPRSEFGRHVHHPLARTDQLIAEQATQPTSALDCPDPPRPPPRPAPQHLQLINTGHDPDLTDNPFRSVERHRGMRLLVRINADHHANHRHLHLASRQHEHRGGHV
jgi:hypothetical protein